MDKILEQLRLTDEERDACMPSKEQLEAYLAEPDDEIAGELRESLDTETFQLLATLILYGRNIAQAQLNKALNHPDIVMVDREKELPEYVGNGSVSHGLTKALAQEVQQDMLAAGWVFPLAEVKEMEKWCIESR